MNECERLSRNPLRCIMAIAYEIKPNKSRRLLVQLVKQAAQLRQTAEASGYVEKGREKGSVVITVEYDDT